MKKKWNITKIIFLLLSCVLFACGCSRKAEQKEAEALPEQNTEMPTLHWWMVGSVPNDYDICMADINDYLKEKLDFQLNIHFVEWSDWQETTSDMINNKEYFDLMFVDVTNFNQFVSLDALQDITDLLYNITPELLHVMPKHVWDGARQSGRVYAVPTYKDSALCQYWAFDDRYIRKYDVSLDELNTWKDLDGYFRTVKQGEGADFYPVLLSKGNNLNIFNEYDNFTCGLSVIGVRPDDPERRVVCLLEEPKIIEKINFLRQWYLDGIINPDANVRENLNEPRSFFLGIGWPGAEAVWQHAEGIEKVVCRKEFGPIYSRDSIQGSMNAISANSKYKKEALQLLELINTDHKLRDMLAYGVEGRNFEYVSENVVRRLNNDWEVSAYTQGTFFNMSILEDEREDGWEQLKKNNEQAEKSVILDCEINLRELSVEVSACKEIWDDYYWSFTRGVVNPETAVPECLRKLREHGLDIIISEVQKQIDAYYR